MKGFKSDPAKDQKHRIELAKQYDQYREDYKKKLNPADYPGNLSLIFELDTKVCLITTDNSTYIGELSSFDHFGNVVLSKVADRNVSVEGQVLDTHFGTIFIRAEQILMIGKVDQKKEKTFFGGDEETPEE